MPRLTEQEEQKIICFIEAVKPLPDKREVELGFHPIRCTALCKLLNNGGVIFLKQTSRLAISNEHAWTDYRFFWIKEYSS